MNHLSILGSGISGIGAALLAKKKGYKVFVSDKNKISENNKSILKKNNISYEENTHSIEILKDSSLIIKSPGISNNSYIINILQQNKNYIISEIDFAYRFIKNKNIITITGTNGKSTTASLTYHILKTAGKSVCLAGNIGNSICQEIYNSSIHDYYIIELSCFQLEDIKELKTDISVLLNISRDHLDRYDFFEDYIATKLKIFDLLKKGGHFIYNKDNIYINEKIKNYSGALSINTFLENKKTISLLDNLSCYLSKDKIPLLGNHNYMNIKFASKIAQLCYIDLNVIKSAITTFRGLSHRLEFVKKLNGIQFFDDSKATNLDSVVKSLDTFNNFIVWIAGGIDKGNDYSKISPKSLKKIKFLICIGKNNESLKNFFKNKFIFETRNMYEAVKIAYNFATKEDIVLLSPGCSSLDLFSSFEERGNIFQKSIHKLSNQIIKKNNIN